MRQEAWTLLERWHPPLRPHHRLVLLRTSPQEAITRPHRPQTLLDDCIQRDHKRCTWSAIGADSSLWPKCSGDQHGHARQQADAGPRATEATTQLALVVSGVGGIGIVTVGGGGDRIGQVQAADLGQDVVGRLADAVGRALVGSD